MDELEKKIKELFRGLAVDIMEALNAIADKKTIKGALSKVENEVAEAIEEAVDDLKK